MRIELLACSALAWILVHAGIAGTRVRGAIAGRIGEAGFRGLFSLVSVAAIAALVASYARARAGGAPRLWAAPGWVGWVLVAFMAAAFILLAASLAAPGPTAVGGERLLGQAPRGMLRITRHPMLWSFAIWSAVHVVGNGDLVSLLFFGAFGVTALAGMPSIDAKLAARDRHGWLLLAAATSILPFGAIAAGRNRLALRELGWAAPAAGLAGGTALLLLHRHLFGVPALPW